MLDASPDPGFPANIWNERRKALSIIVNLFAGFCYCFYAFCYWDASYHHSGVQSNRGNIQLRVVVLSSIR